MSEPPVPHAESAEVSISSPLPKKSKSSRTKDKERDKEARVSSSPSASTTASAPSSPALKHATSSHASHSSSRTGSHTARSPSSHSRSRHPSTTVPVSVPLPSSSSDLVADVAVAKGPNPGETTPLTSPRSDELVERSPAYLQVLADAPSPSSPRSVSPLATSQSLSPRSARSADQDDRSASASESASPRPVPEAGVASSSSPSLGSPSSASSPVSASSSSPSKPLSSSTSAVPPPTSTNTTTTTQSNTSPSSNPNNTSNTNLSEQSSDALGPLRAATLDELIAALTTPVTSSTSSESESLLFEVLLTYRSFTTPLELLRSLFHVYHLPGSDRFDASARRERIYHIVRIWIEEHWEDFARDAATLCAELERVHLEAQGAFDLLPSNLRALLELAQLFVRSPPQRKQPQTLATQMAPEPILPEAMSEVAEGVALHVLDLDPLEVARQMTLMDEALWRAIRPWELLQLAWTREDKARSAPNVLRMIVRFNSASRWVQGEVVREESLETRVAVLRFVLRLLKALLALRNYNGAQTLAAAFAASALFRLKKTLLHLTERERDELATAQLILGREGNYKALRDTLKTHALQGHSAIPYLGMYLTDLMFIEEGVPDTLPDGRINLVKRRQISDVIREILAHQGVAYALAPVPRIQALLLAAPALDDDALYALSQWVEPRNTTKARSGSKSKESKEVVTAPRPPALRNTAMKAEWRDRFSAEDERSAKRGVLRKALSAYGSTSAVKKRPESMMARPSEFSELLGGSELATSSPALLSSAALLSHASSSSLSFTASSPAPFSSSSSSSPATSTSSLLGNASASASASASPKTTAKSTMRRTQTQRLREQILVDTSFTALLAQATAPAPAFDSALVEDVLLTYHSFCSSEELLEAIMARFTLPTSKDAAMPLPLSPRSRAELEGVRASCLLFMVKWIVAHSADFHARHTTLLALLEQWQKAIDFHPHLSAFKTEISMLTTKAARLTAWSPPPKESDPPPPRFKPSIQDIFDVDELEVARQLCLINQEHFIVTRPPEYVNLAWMKVNRKRESPHLLRLLEHFDALRGWPIAALLSAMDASERKSRLKFFVTLVKHLSDLNNYFAVSALIRGLKSPHLQRVPKLWSSLSSGAQKQWDMLVETAGPEAMDRVRKEHETCALPAVPDVRHVFIEDFQAVHEANSLFGVESDGGVINFGKRREEAGVLRRLLRFQLKVFCFEAVPQLRALLAEQPSASDDASAKRLLDFIIPLIEKKVSADSTLKPRELMTTAERLNNGQFRHDAEWMARCKVEPPTSYPFAAPDKEDNIVEAKSFGRVTIVGATPAKLLERLTLPGPLAVDESAGASLLRVFLTTYRHFLSPKELLDLLIARFRSPKLLSNFDDKDILRFFITHVLIQFHTRVLRILELWIEQFPLDFFDEERSDVIKATKAFLQDVVLPLGPPPSFLPGSGSHYKKEHDRILALLDPNRPTRASPALPPPSLGVLSERPSQQCTVLDFEPREIARQLCLHDHSLLSQMSLSELLFKNYLNASTSATVHSLALRRKALTALVRTEISDALSEPNRELLLKRWCFVARELDTLRNWNSFAALVEGVGLFTSSKELWIGVPEDIKRLINEYHIMLNAPTQLSNLKSHLFAERQTKVPSIPYFPPIVEELTFLESQRFPDPYLSPKCINLERCVALSEIIESLVVPMMRSPYNLAPVPAIEKYLLYGLSRDYTSSSSSSSASSTTASLSSGAPRRAASASQATSPLPSMPEKRKKKAQPGATMLQLSRSPGDRSASNRRIVPFRSPRSPRSDDDDSSQLSPPLSPLSNAGSESNTSHSASDDESATKTKALS